MMGVIVLSRKCSFRSSDIGLKQADQEKALQGEFATSRIARGAAAQPQIQITPYAAAILRPSANDGATSAMKRAISSLT